ncbi:hypothetical protein E2C01_004855 [Portunus trituberculatus]|uniref:Uncharacterized protein n=1 Tax=Portunus trituberculatus TaxID=210409 RepID=A0A5B7CQS8_PORTR|nr:hypothetical protein [Portunus trituberculatus]
MVELAQVLSPSRKIQVDACYRFSNNKLSKLNPRKYQAIWRDSGNFSHDGLTWQTIIITPKARAVLMVGADRLEGEKLREASSVENFGLKV